MGCVSSSQRVDVMAPTNQNHNSWHDASEDDTVVAVLTRLDLEITASEKSYPSERFAVVTAELDVIQQEIKEFGETNILHVNTESYAKTLHQIFLSLDLYRRPVLASENEDFIANVNRKEMRRLELLWLRTRQRVLQREQRALHAQLLRTRVLYSQLQKLLDSVWSNGSRPGTAIEGALGRSHALRSALASVGERLRASVEYAHAALRLMDDALRAWKLTSVAKNGWDHTAACADACHVLIQARCNERGARRVLAASAAPRAARSLRLALDYAFTDAMHDHKYQRATETFIQFKDALTQLVNTIHQIRRQSKEINVFINGKAITVPSYFTILQALRRERVTIPTFCYHERLSIAGNCRMCLVQVEGMWKPQIACAMPVSKDMKIRTNSSITRQAQEGVLEFILVDHPLDCPICDQGGECDLQDLSMRFGNDRTRFTDIHFTGKRASQNKNLGPLIRTEMTRCIHCTRCIRFASQVCGLDVLGTSGRGAEMLVGTYVEKKFLSELSGNIIDLCPVGALTAIPYRFKARPWEVKRTNSIDVTDATGTNIVVNHRFDRVLRVLPREHDEINQEWVSDKGRWAIDSLEMQRLVTPMYRNENCLCPVEWDCALSMAANLIKCVSAPHKIMAVAGPHCNVETLVAAKDFLNMLGCENTYIERGLTYSTSGIDIRAGYSLNINMKDIIKADKILLVGTNPRFEAPVLNAWIRQAYMFNECDIYVIGPVCEFNYHVNYLGDDANAVCKAGDVLKGANKPLIFVGLSQLETPNGGQIMCALSNIAAPFGGDPHWSVLNVLTREASFAGALEGGWKTGGAQALCTMCPHVLISLGADDIFYDWNPHPDCKVIYIGFQGDRGSECASIVLPGSAYTESGGTFMNMECRTQFAMPAVTPPGKARYDWKIIRALAEYTGVCLFYSDATSLCWRLAQVSPNFVAFGDYQQKLFSELIPPLIDAQQKGSGPLEVDMPTLRDYYCSDVFTYNSPTMVKAQKAAVDFVSSRYAKV